MKTSCIWCLHGLTILAYCAVIIPAAVGICDFENIAGNAGLIAFATILALVAQIILFCRLK